jgi:hypothetical protein
MLLTEEEIVEHALLRYAQKAATRWGAERFAAEFERRNHEERWLNATRSNTTRAPARTDAADAPRPAVTSGLVDASVEHRVVGPDREEMRLTTPKYSRHPSVPRPPTPERGEDRRGRGGRRGRGRHRSAEEPTWTTPPAEVARMSPAARRLHGLSDPSGPDRA